MPASIIDCGIPEFFASGLLRVEPLKGGMVRFVLYRDIPGREGNIEDPVLTVVMPAGAVGPGIELTIASLGAALVLPAVGYVARRLFQ